MEIVLNLVDKVVTSDMNHTLLQPYTSDEEKKALFSMHPSKLPRPDGMSPFFFQKYWHIVGNNVIDAMLDFLESGHMVPGINSTNIVLIPNVKSPKKCLIFALLAFVM